MAYSTLADVAPFLPSGELPNPARYCEGSASGDYLESDGHGLSDDAEVTFRAETGGTLPTGLTAVMVGAGTYQAAVLVATTAPAAPRVTATVCGPRAMTCWAA